MKHPSLLRCLVLVSPLLLIGCASVPYYATTTPNPATLKMGGKTIWSGADWNDHYGLPREANIKTMVLLEMVDEVQLNPRMGFGAMGPWKIDAGKRRIQLAVNEANGLFRGTFEFPLEPGRTYTILAVRNPKIATDGAGAVVALLTEVRTRGTLVAREEGDARDYYYQLKLFEEYGPTSKEAASVDAILMQSQVK